MKVKEFIRQLEQLDQEKEIFVIYDSFSLFDPEVEVADEDSCRLHYLEQKGLREGDYVIIAG